LQIFDLPYFKNIIFSVLYPKFENTCLGIFCFSTTLLTHLLGKIDMFLVFCSSRKARETNVPVVGRQPIHSDKTFDYEVGDIAV